MKIVICDLLGIQNLLSRTRDFQGRKVVMIVLALFFWLSNLFVGATTIVKM